MRDSSFHLHFLPLNKWVRESRGSATKLQWNVVHAAPCYANLLVNMVTASFPEPGTGAFNFKGIC